MITPRTAPITLDPIAVLFGRLRTGKEMAFLLEPPRKRLMMPTLGPCGKA
jgi:hypothetical protein